jgi:indole-3-glycerol phosphate synthase
VWDPVALGRAYAAGGARCLSVLTDGRHFWGSDDHLVACRAAVDLPVLRKDFVVEAYQVDESRWLGADAVLLMASVLDDDALVGCAARAAHYGMASLVESHTDAQLDRVLALGLDPQTTLLGINHRDLESLSLDMERVLRLLPRVPATHTVVAESGLSSPASLRRLLDAGVGAFLIGGHVAQSDDPEAALREMIAA